MYAYNQMMAVAPDSALDDTLRAIDTILYQIEMGFYEPPPGVVAAVHLQRNICMAEVVKRLDLMGSLDHSSDEFEL